MKVMKLNIMNDINNDDINILHICYAHSSKTVSLVNCLRLIRKDITNKFYVITKSIKYVG